MLVNELTEFAMAANDEPVKDETFSEEEWELNENGRTEKEAHLEL